MLRLSATVIAAVVFVGSASLIASAQEGPPPDASPPRDPTRISVTTRVYDQHTLLTASTAIPENVRRGRAVWLQRCAYCHDGVGQPSYQTMGPWLGAETLAQLGEPAVRILIASGTDRMPGFSYALQPAQLNDLIAFLKTVTTDQKPTADQLAGRTALGNGD